MYVSAPFAGLSVDAVFVLASAISLAASLGFTLAFYRMWVGRAAKLLAACPI